MMRLMNIVISIKYLIKNSIKIKNCTDFAFNQYTFGSSSCCMKKIVCIGQHFMCGVFCYIQDGVIKENPVNDSYVTCSEQKIKAEHILYYC